MGESLHKRKNHSLKARRRFRGEKSGETEKNELQKLGENPDGREKRERKFQRLIHVKQSAPFPSSSLRPTMQGKSVKEEVSQITK